MQDTHGVITQEGLSGNPTQQVELLLHDERKSLYLRKLLQDCCAALRGDVQKLLK